ncbi:ABC transporter substrate-binding protein [Halalkalicoccus jeotgali]|uniref:Extracellular solute-binding protein family 5 n=1 Tax=Halalkalicoccus jeotgali (strain DSM 18796 / CECT 7217 / JCM 14584 / KCTC 4019 / B3) TaxID=795797 RepID=D8JAT7_HALJB|nr:ABC transporter substrate-binding protein [Halalkalicoccus jeotgali]ADJ14809.1 extracellular solute-binding protein family 5 [Halalkalicoccus jeotgali B3]ELY39391.1 family 5 extracellular solute-binding protein [Halalkalicoccus jeotgali B3]
MPVPKGPLGRRTLLASTAGALAASAGCLNRFQASVDRDTPEQVSLSISTVPADEDPVPVGIARHLAETFATAGIDVGLQPVTTEKLWRNVLLNQNFDLYVGQHPGHFDPDYLYGLLHSRFSEEPGWQNPYGYVNVPGVDDPLETQRTASGDTRTTALSSLAEAVREEAPLSVVAYPEESRAIRTDRYSGWSYRSFESPLGYLGLQERTGAERGSRPRETLRVGITDRRITYNLNPLSAEYRDRWVVTGLLYDPLGRYIEGAVEPWLADDWSWIDDRLRVRLREGLTWHDGTDLTAHDVAFTHRLLRDTTGTAESPTVPAPCFRARSSLVDGVEATGERTVEFALAGTPETGLRALTVPILPTHIWEERTALTSIAVFDLENVTEALVVDNMNPVGSGPLRFEAATPDTRLELVRNDEHFLAELSDGSFPAFEGGPPYERLTFVYFPSEATLVESIQAGDLDASATALSPGEIERARQASEVDLAAETTSAYYHVGFNTRNAPLSNPRFRRALSRLLDREYLRTEVFAGNAIPAFDPIAVGGPDDEWTTDHPAGFVGESGSGTVEEKTAHDLFREAGYIYNEGGELIVR